jgi:aryl-alcohol dehydrogenase-like predicted oxidoreductase
MTAVGKYDPIDSTQFKTAFGAWTLTLIDKGTAPDKQHVELFKYAFRAGFEFGDQT